MLVILHVLWVILPPLFIVCMFYSFGVLKLIEECHFDNDMVVNITLKNWIERIMTEGIKRIIATISL